MTSRRTVEDWKGRSSLGAGQPRAVNEALLDTVLWNASISHFFSISPGATRRMMIVLNSKIFTSGIMLKNASLFEHSYSKFTKCANITRTFFSLQNTIRI